MYITLEPVSLFVEKKIVVKKKYIYIIFNFYNKPLASTSDSSTTTTESSTETSTSSITGYKIGNINYKKRLVRLVKKTPDIEYHTYVCTKVFIKCMVLYLAC